MSDLLKLRRDQLQAFLGDDEDAIRAFELLFEENRGIFFTNRNTADPNLPLLSVNTGDVLGGTIIEQGSNSNGSYVVFSSGIQVCWLNDQSFSFGPSNTYGSVYQDQFSWVFPRAFKSGTLVSTPSPGVLFGSNAPWSASRASNSSTFESYRILDAFPFGTVSGSVALFAIGEAS